MKLTDDIFIEKRLFGGEVVHTCSRCGGLILKTDIHLKFEQEKMDHDSKIRDFMHQQRSHY